MASQSLLTRHSTVRKRSFARHLDLFLTALYLRRTDGTLHLTNPDEYLNFQPTVEEKAAYLRSYQARSLSEPFAPGRTVQSLDDAIRQWRAANPTLEAALRVIHDQHYCLSAEEFKHLVNNQAGELACEYCELTESDFRQLIERDLVRTKRLSTRGSTFEFDCRDPEQGYTKDNVALCCYWCNNAKTDEYSTEEFKPVALALAAIWRHRLLTSSTGLH
jgi:5-methylcytosine-specific restriction endonuclease McrA